MGFKSRHVRGTQVPERASRGSLNHTGTCRCSEWLRVMSDRTGLILSLQSQTDFNRVIQDTKLTFDKMCNRCALMKRKMDLSVNKTTYWLCSHSSKHAYQQNGVCMPKGNISHNTTFLNGSHRISGWKPLHFSSQIIQSQSKQFHFKINTYWRK